MLKKSGLYHIFFVIFFSYCSIYADALNGVLQIHESEINAGNIIGLKGQWYFVPDRFLTYEETRNFFESQKAIESVMPIKVPGSWNQSRSEARGYGTYLLHLKGLKPSQTYSISLKDTLTAYRLFICSTEEECRYPVLQNGVVGISGEEGIPQHLPLLRDFYVKEKDAWVIVHLSNYNDSVGGMIYHPEVALPDVLRKKRDTSRSKDFFILGVLFIMMIYHAELFRKRRDDFPSLLFSVFNLIIAVRLMLTEKYIQEFFPEPSEWIFESFMKIDTFTFYIAGPIFYSFLNRLFPNYLNIKIEKLFWYIFTIFCPGLLLSQFYYSQVIFLYQIISLVAIVFMMAGLIKAIKDKIDGAIISFVGFLFAVFTAIHDMLHVLSIISTTYTFQYGVLTFIITHSTIIANHFSNAHKRAEHLSLNLQKEVEAQTMKLVEANHLLKEADKQKTIFFQNISHDLRTPLTLILGPLHSILNREYGAISDPLNEILLLMKKNAEQLLRLINQLLDMAKIESGHIELNLQPVKIDELLSEVISSFSLISRQKKINIQFQKPVFSQWVYGDTDKLEKVFYNLLSNAIKFTYMNGNIKITLKNEDGCSVINIMDDGQGISREDQPFIFQRFKQGKVTSSTKTEGSGIGLSIVHSYIELHGGKISFSSEPGHGTNFTIILPIHFPDEVKNNSEIDRAKENEFYPDYQNDVEETSNRKMLTVLVAEDNPDMSVFIKHVLRKKYNVISAENGIVAWNLIRSTKPDIIITDFLMPEMNGEELIGKLKQDKQFMEIPVLMLTARLEMEHANFSQEYQPDYFLPKPFVARELLEKLEEIEKRPGFRKL